MRVEAREVSYQLGIDVELGLFLLLRRVFFDLGIVRDSGRSNEEEETLVELTRELPELSEAFFHREVLNEDREYATTYLIEER